MIKAHISKLTSLNDWLEYIESIHKTEIDLGLTRIAQVAQKIGVNFNKSKVITVAGTNGKGTTCAFLENALLSKQYSVAVYSSPHISIFNERLRVNQRNIDDKSLIDAFIQVEVMREEISLSYYEFTTLAAFIILQTLSPDYIILEVGLGGRLDATNIIDADVAVMTTIDLDHQVFLGDTRAKIGVEKAGIVRSGRPVVVGEPDMPFDVVNFIAEKGAIAHYRNKSFKVVEDHSYWQYSNEELALTFDALQPANIPIDNVATAITVLGVLSIDFTQQQINQIIAQTQVPGRYQLIQTAPDVVLDVGHNPQAARYLAKKIQCGHYQKVYAVVGMLADKDCRNTFAEMVNVIDRWYVCDLAVARGNSAIKLQNELNNLHQQSNCFDNVVDGYRMALSQASADDLIVVFGSFFTVAEIHQLLA